MIPNYHHLTLRCSTFLLHLHAIYQFPTHPHPFNSVFISTCGLILVAIVYAKCAFHLVSVRTIVSIYRLMLLVVVTMIDFEVPSDKRLPIHTKSRYGASEFISSTRH